MSRETKPAIEAFFDETTNTVTYLVSDPETKAAAIIDSVLDYDPRSGKVTTSSADRILAAISAQGLTIDWILETHAHADHLSAAQYLKAHTGANVGIGIYIDAVREIFDPVFNLEPGDKTRNEFDHYFRDGEHFKIGNLDVEVLATPGHTPACISYKIEDAVFVGDTLFMPDYGTARADFPGGDAQTLYNSIQRLLALPDTTRVYLCHDYKAPGRDHYVWETTIAEERLHNIHIHDGISADEFIAMRNKRDATLSAPTLLLPSIQINIHAGHLPRASDNGRRYLKIPLTIDDEKSATL